MALEYFRNELKQARTACQERLASLESNMARLGITVDKMERLDRKTCRAINGALQDLSRQYWPTQAKAIDACLVALDDQGIMPLGELLMLDENGRGSFELERNENGLQHMLVISTYPMPSGRYELNAYLS